MICLSFLTGMSLKWTLETDFTCFWKCENRREPCLFTVKDDELYLGAGECSCSSHTRDKAPFPFIEVTCWNAESYVLSRWVENCWASSGISSPYCASWRTYYQVSFVIVGKNIFVLKVIQNVQWTPQFWIKVDSYGVGIPIHAALQ